MNHSNQSSKQLFKKISFTYFLSFAVLFAFQFLAAFLLMKLNHFESYFSFVPWVAGVFVSFVIALVFRSSGKEAVVLALISAFLFFFSGIGVGFFLKPPLALMQVLPRAAIFTVLSPLFVLLLRTSRKKHHKHSGKNNFRFLK